MIAEWGVFWLGWTIAGAALWPAYIVDFLLAYLFGIAFQYFAIVPMRHLSLGEGLKAAVKADTLSLTAYEIGMFVWMGIVYFVLFHPHLKPTVPAYWFRSFEDRLVPGQGEIPLADFLRAVRETGYAGAYSVEIFSKGVPDALWEGDLEQVFRDSQAGVKNAWHTALSG